MTKKIAIIGNGLVGTFAALAAAQDSDSNVILFDRHGKERQGSSKTGYGECSRCIRFRGEEPALTPLIRRSLQAYASLQEKTAADFLTFNRAAVIAPQNHKSLGKAEENLQAHGLTRDGYEVQGSAALKKINGLDIFDLPEHYQAVLEQPGAANSASVSATFSPAKLFDATDRLLDELPNVQIRNHTEVSWEVVHKPEHGEPADAAGKIRIHTPSGSEIVDSLIIAPGQDIAAHLAQAGIDVKPSFEPVHLMHYRLSGEVGEALKRDGRSLPFFLMSYDSGPGGKPATVTGESYLWGLGQRDEAGNPVIKLGFSSDKVSSPSPEDALPAQRAAALTKGDAMIKDLHLRKGVVAERAGDPVTCYYTMPPDGKKIPVLGTLDIKGLAPHSHVAVFGLDAGVSGKLAPAVGELLAALARGREIDSQYRTALEAMSPYRYGKYAQLARDAGKTMEIHR